MTDMIKNVAHDLGGIGIYGIFSIFLFISFFLGMLIWVVCARKSYIESMRALPLEDDAPAATRNSAHTDDSHE